MAALNAGPIFVVEDDPADREAICRVIVSRFDRQYEVFSDARDAAEAIADGIVPSVILLDHGLPAVSGMELLRLLRASPKTAGIPVVIFSGLVDDIKESAWQEGANCVVRKPPDAHEFARVVENVCALYLRAGVGDAPQP